MLSAGVNFVWWKNEFMTFRRDCVVAAISIFATVSVMTLAKTVPHDLLHSCVIQWSDLKLQQTSFGARRSVFDAPTVNLDRFECHVTTLNPGASPHAEHRHSHEEMMIIKDGVIEVAQNNLTNRVEPGGIIFCASSELHGLRNVGTNPATYYVLAWHPPQIKKSGLWK